MVELKNVNVHYSSGVDALQDINLRINDGEFVFIVGGSGAGKSTLVKLLMREITPTTGRVFVNGKNLAKLKGNQVAKFRRSIGMVFQDFRLIQELNVYENVAFVLRIADQSSRFIKQRVPYVLNLVDLAHKARSKPRELSGGEQQRVAIARALANDPGLIIADEPTGNIDPRLSYEIVELLRDINRSAGTTIIMVTHEHDLVKHFGGRIINIDSGSITFDDIIGGQDEDE
ncbi:MAG: cell division ATP-binding protein FtsE [Oscillospiraceae bacterium]